MNNFSSESSEFMSYNQYAKQASPTDRSGKSQLTYPSKNKFYNMKSQHTTSLTNKRPLEYPSVGSFGQSYGTSSKGDMHM